MSEPVWRMRITHLTQFTYEPPARASYNEVRMMPLTTPRQTTLTAQITTLPDVRQYRYWDYWGSQVAAFDIPQAHTALEIRAAAMVDSGTADVTHPTGGHAAVSWPELSARTEALCELLQPTPYTEPAQPIDTIAREIRQADPASTVDAVLAWVNANLAYEQGVTSVHTSALDALEAGRGVCQDFAHLAVALLRILGIPARYVSGYLHPQPDPRPGEEVAGESHAWVEAWIGRWHEVDPTNLVPVGPRHIVVARGRDYADVPPVKGVYAGGGSDGMTTTVAMTRVS